MSKETIVSEGRVYERTDDSIEWANHIPLTARDHIANAALSGALGNVCFMSERTAMRRNADEIAKLCYELADAMLAERNKKEAPSE